MNGAGVRAWRVRGRPGVQSALPGQEKGFSLVIVMWVLAILMLAVTGFTYSMRVEAYGARDFMERTEARYLAVSGVNTAVARIKKGYDLVYLDREGALVFASRDGDGIKPLWTGAGAFDLGGGKVSFRVEDERGKINLNTSTAEVIKGLLRAVGVDIAERDTVADSIIDWTDENHEFHLNGAEDDYYLSLPAPYQAKDGPFDTVGELLLVRGVTPGIFYGTGEEAPGIEAFLTVKGDGRININTAPEAVLEAAYGKGVAMEILLHRTLEGMFTSPRYNGAVTSTVFSITSTGEAGGARETVRAVIDYDPGTGEVKVTHWTRPSGRPRSGASMEKG